MRKLYFITLAIGVWLIVGPFVLNFGPTVELATPAVSENLVLGVLVCGLSLIALTGDLYARGVDWLLVLFGIWVIFNPLLYSQWAFDASQTTNNALAGASIIFIAAVELVSFSRRAA